MAGISEKRIVELLEPYADGSFQLDSLAPKFTMYLELLLRWNARTNLTAIREPEEIVQRHFGESVFAAKLLASSVPATGSLLDLGSGAGFPGLPIQLCLPGLQVVLAESQGKKASFLREAVRSLGLSTEVWAARAEAMAADRRFDVVCLRAVDRMSVALKAATERVSDNGVLLVLAGDDIVLPDGWKMATRTLIPATKARFAFVATR